jgi:hypothetical protein
MLVWVETIKAAGAQKDVGLPLQRLAKGVATLGDDVVKDAARREDVHCIGLKRNAEYERTWAEFSLCSQPGRGTPLLLLWSPGRCFRRIGWWV